MLALGLFLLNSCKTVPVSGRQQLSIIPSSQMLAMSFQQYDDFLKQNDVLTGTPESEMVKRIGRKIQFSVEEYLKENNLGDLLNGYSWEFNLVASDLINAWCMPGGKVVVYTGILDVTESETGLAVVMGHEIAHAIAEHGNERMSQLLLVQLGGIALNEALDSEPEKTRAMWLAAYGASAQLGVLLPYSRLHESEADQLGLIFMAMAGYNPEEAVAFWGRMADLKQGQAPPEFLSTHPSDQTRISDIKKLLPEAMKYYKGG
jgi:predicted Zn-dependent protease